MLELIYRYRWALLAIDALVVGYFTAGGPLP